MICGILLFFFAYLYKQVNKQHNFKCAWENQCTDRKTALILVLIYRRSRSEGSSGPTTLISCGDWGKLLRSRTLEQHCPAPWRWGWALSLPLSICCDSPHRAPHAVPWVKMDIHRDNVDFWTAQGALEKNLWTVCFWLLYDSGEIPGHKWDQFSGQTSWALLHLGSPQDIRFLFSISC